MDTAIIQIFIAVVIAKFLWTHNVHASSDLDAIRPAIHRRFSLVSPLCIELHIYVPVADYAFNIQISTNISESVDYPIYHRIYSQNICSHFCVKMPTYNFRAAHFCPCSCEVCRLFSYMCLIYVQNLKQSTQYYIYRYKTDACRATEKGAITKNLIDALKQHTDGSETIVQAVGGMCKAVGTLARNQEKMTQGKEN